MDAYELERYFRDLLRIDEYAQVDTSVNGLQVANRGGDIRKMAFAVDACLETALRARDAGAQALFVHHGLLWGKQLPVVGGLYGRFRALLEADLALFACHLPLDAHPELGNNARIAAAMGLGELVPFGEYRGRKVGWGGKLPRPERVQDLLGRAFPSREPARALLAFGPDPVERVAIVSGGGAFDVREAIASGYGLFVTGEPEHSVYHEAMEAGVTMAAMGHYATETFGVRAVAEHVSRELGLETLFLDYPTGL